MKKYIGVFLAVLFVISALCMPVSAVSVFYLSDSKAGSALETADEAAVTEIGLKYNTGSNDCFFLPYSSNGTSTEAYYFNRATKDKKKAMNAMTESLKNSPDVKSSDLQVIYNALKEIDDRYITSAIADLLNSSSSGMLNAVVILKPFVTPIGTVLGVVAILMVLLMVLTTVVDFVYIGLPFADKTNGDKPKFMSRDAYKALQESVDGSTSQVYLAYLKKRALTYGLTVICVIYLVSGGFGDLFLSITDLFGGIF
jgi:hypothetical protein